MFSPGFEDAIKVLDQGKSSRGTLFEIIEYKKPRKTELANILYQYNNNNQNIHKEIQTHQFVGEKMRQVRIHLNGGGLITQPGALQFMKGSLEMQMDGSVASSLKGFFKHLGTGESGATPRYCGKGGEIYLEPSFKYFYMLELDNEEMILDDGMFYCCEDSVELGVHTNTSIATGLFGGDGFRQPKIKGSGLAILESDVPFEEILIYQLNNDTLKVDGNFAMVIRGNISSRIEKSTKSILGTLRSGEGLIQTFSGTGEVWLAPSRYQKPYNG